MGLTPRKKTPKKKGKCINQSSIFYINIFKIIIFLGSSSKRRPTIAKMEAMEDSSADERDWPSEYQIK